MSGLRHRDWHLISEQRFRRRAMLDIVPQRFRGQPYIVIGDSLSGQYLRLNGRARLLWERLDGSLSMQEIWRALAGLEGETPPGQKELTDWVVQLSSVGFILSDHEIDPSLLRQRGQSRRDKKLEGKAVSPLAIRLPLFDPDPLVRRLYPLARPLFSRAGALCLMLLTLAGLIAGIVNLPRLMASPDTALLSQSGLMAMLIAYPVMKALHELGHALTLYHYGGRVREAGVMLLIFFPLPYVDVSSAVAIASHRARMMVGAAGVIVEVAMAAAALLLWLQAEPGLAQAVLFSFVLMGTISTVAFNGNPLLKFDGYYVMADWLQMPNLAQRAGAFLQDRFLARLLGLRPQETAPPDEAPILIAYGIGSLAYRMLLTFVIVALVSQMFFVLGLLLAAWSLIMAIGWPLFKMIRKGQEMTRRENARRQVSLRLILVSAFSFGLIFLMPLPFLLDGEGQLITSPAAEIRAGASGFVPAGAGFPAEGEALPRDSELLRLENPAQHADAVITRAALEQITTRLAAPGLSPAARQISLARQRSLATSLDQLQIREAGLSLRMPLAGRLAWVAGHPPLPGSFIERGALVASVAEPDMLEAVIAFPAFFAGLLPADGAMLNLRLADGTEAKARILRRQMLDQGDIIPGPLRSSAGGTIAEDPARPGHALAPAIAVWAKPEAGADGKDAPGADLSRGAGQRFEASLRLAPRSLAGQILFRLNRIFLRLTRY